MIAVRIAPLGPFMKAMLSGNLLDSFLLVSCTMVKSCSMTIEGPVPWSSVQEYCYDFMKGKELPQSFRFVYKLAEGDSEQSPSGANSHEPTTGDGISRILTLRYESEVLTLTTGTACATFTMDRAPERLWDDTVRRFLADSEEQYGIGWEEI